MLIAQCISDFTASHGLTVSLFLAGLVGGVSHCSGMCAPFVIAQTNGDFSLKRLGSFLLLPYHLGRMTTYVAMAVVLNSLVNLAFLFSEAKILIAAPLLFTAGILFMVTAFPALGRLFPWVAAIRMPHFMAPHSSLISKFSEKGIFRGYILGLLLGFMPCGLVISALMAASTAQNSIHAAISMAAFALGTMPVLILIGIGGKIALNRYPAFSKRFSQVAMAVSSLWLFVLAGQMIF